MQAIWTLVNDLVTEHNSASANTVNIFRYIPPAEWPAIQNRASAYDCHAAVMSALNSTTSGAGSSAIGAYVSFPAGAYRFSQTIELKRGCGLLGLGSGLTGGYPVEFVFSAGVTGLIVQRHDTEQGGVGPSTTGADAAIIVGVAFRGAGYSSDTPEAHGVYLRARAKCVGVVVTNFKGDGFRIVAVAGASDASRLGNANLFHLENCAGNANWGSGLFIDGADANSGNVIAFNSVNNGRWGIWDASFLGNTYLGCHAATNSRRGQVFHLTGRYYLIDDSLGGSTEPGTNPAVWVYLNDSGPHSTYPQWVSGASYVTGGAYKSDSDSAVSSFFGCYSEGGQAPSNIIAPAIVYGGLHGAGFSANSSCFIISAGRLTTFEVKASAGSAANFNIEFAKRANEAIALSVAGDHVNGLSPFTWDAASGTWVTRHARLNGRTPVSYTTELSTFSGGRPTAVGAGHVVFSRGAFVCDRMLSYGNNPPTAGEAGRGDMVFNKLAGQGQPSYWQCTTAGTNGVDAVWTAGPVLP